MNSDQLLPRRTPESRAYMERIPEAMNLSARLNALPFDDLEAREAALRDILGGSLPSSLNVLPPFYCDYGLNARFGEGVFINQGCYFSDFGGISVGDRVMIGPRVTLTTVGHPVDLDRRHDGITHAPIVIEDDVWIGAGATITQGVTIGRGSVVGEGTVVAKDVPALCMVTGTSHVERRALNDSAGLGS